ncbi:PQQ-binding-like beta-propeller repeat protein (plasmid) [Haladaptatus sp. SPP-AMP-3]|uniref:outer membrane protein assembly factor BamB family protein n=1 Tax=Haladaptatus sp. SPP-AMP-3 TaxID=3121295 RepID=UPI003C30B554
MKKQLQLENQRNNRRTFLKTVGLTLSAAAIETGNIVAKESDSEDPIVNNEWTTVRSNPNRTGAISGDGPKPYATTDRKLDLDGSMLHKEPIVTNDAIYLSITTNGNSEESAGYIAGYDRETGDLKWKQSDLPSPKTPSVDDDLLYVATNVPESPEANNGGLYALDINDGSIEWSRTDDLRWISPLVVEDQVFTANEDGAVALNKQTGETIWRTPGIGTLTDGSDGALSYGDGVLFFSDGKALNSSDGSVRWDIGDKAATYANHIVSNKRVYYLKIGYIDGSDDTVTLESRLVADGSIDWTRGLENTATVDKRFAVTDNSLILFDSSEEDTVIALNPENGSTQWTQELAGEFFSRPTAANDTVYIGGRYMLPSKPGVGKALIYAIDVATGDLKWVHLLDTGSLETSPEEPPAAGTPVVAGGKIYTTTYPAGSMLDYEYLLYSNFFVLGNLESKSGNSKETLP